MTQDEAVQYWYSRFTKWTIAVAEPRENASDDAQMVIAQAQVEDLAQSLTDLLLRAGYAPNQVSTAIARGAYLVVAEMVRRYVPGPEQQR
jgi:hypothetical protein